MLCVCVCVFFVVISAFNRRRCLFFFFFFAFRCVLRLVEEIVEEVDGQLQLRPFPTFNDRVKHQLGSSSLRFLLFSSLFFCFVFLFSSPTDQPPPHSLVPGFLRPKKKGKQKRTTIIKLISFNWWGASSKWQRPNYLILVRYFFFPRKRKTNEKRTHSERIPVAGR